MPVIRHVCSLCSCQMTAKDAALKVCHEFGCDKRSDFRVISVTEPTVWFGKIREFMDYHDPILVRIDGVSPFETLWLKLSHSGFLLAKERGIELSVGKTFAFTCSLDDDQTIVGINKVTRSRKKCLPT